MAYIWIIGDSWGDEWCCKTGYGVAPDKGFQYQFEKEGHRVKNLSQGGRSNTFSFRTASIALEKGAEPPTHIIQFWTEPLRDFFPETISKKGWTVEDKIIELTNENIVHGLELKKLANNPHWAIIGGQAQINKSDADKIGCSFHIENWRNEILEKDYSFLASNLVSVFRFFNDYPYNQDSTKIKKRLLKEVDTILQDMAESIIFEDNCHPSWQPYKVLSEQLLNWIKENQ